MTTKLSRNTIVPSSETRNYERFGQIHKMVTTLVWNYTDNKVPEALRKVRTSVTQRGVNLRICALNIDFNITLHYFNDKKLQECQPL